LTIILKEKVVVKIYISVIPLYIYQNPKRYHKILVINNTDNVSPMLSNPQVFHYT
jgi:hypothetical protein